jgi:hypothetical protein
MQARLAAIKRRKKSVEITAGLTAESNGFFLFRKRNPLEQREPRRAAPQHEDEEPGSSAQGTVSSQVSQDRGSDDKA